MPWFPATMAVQGPTPELTCAVFTRNTGGAVGALTDAQLTLADSVLRGNGDVEGGTWTGGVLVAQSAAATVTGTTIRGNRGPAVTLEADTSTINGGSTRSAISADNHLDGEVLLLPLAPEERAEPGQQRTLTVPGDHAEVQDAIDAAADGDTVVVAPGTYRGNLAFNGKRITVRSQDPDDPAVVAATVLEGVQGPVDEWSLTATVSFVAGETRDSVLEGLTVIATDGPEAAPVVEIQAASPTLRNNVLVGGDAIVVAVGHPLSPRHPGDVSKFWALYEDARWGQDSAPLLEDNTIRDGAGGGVIAHAARLTLRGNRFLDNGGGSTHIGSDDTPAYGGWTSTSVVEDNVFEGNQTGSFGAIYGESFELPRWTGNRVVGNLGNGIRTESPTLGVVDANVVIADPDDPGGPGTGGYGIGVLYLAQPKLTNNLVVGFPWVNLLLSGGRQTVAHTTLVHVAEGGTEVERRAIEYQNTDLTLVNSIVADPGFVGDGDYRLRADSPAVDAGIDAGVRTDLEGRSRPQGGGFDLGAYERAGG